MATEGKKDDVTGTYTTGHEWDGISELNTPLPSWWVYVFYATIVWAVAYWVVYPSWPGADGYLKGMFETTNRTELHEDLKAMEAERAVYTDRIAELDVTEISADPELFGFAQAGARSYFAENCAPCHGTNGVGGPGYPVLLDDDWIWGGDLENIELTILYGIRNSNDDARFSDMPAFGRDEILESTDIKDVAQYVLSLSGGSSDAAAVERGAVVYEDNCLACHDEGGIGNIDLGAPNLSDAIWLYGGSEADIIEMVTNSRGGVMPAFTERLSEEQIKMLAVYVHSLGGGQ